MSWNDALVHHVERCIERDFGITGVEQDDDGDYGVMGHGRPVWIRPLHGSEPPLVRLWSPAAYDVKPTVALLRELNDINADAQQLRVAIRHKSVVVSAELEMEALTAGQIGRLAGEIGTTAEGVGEMIATIFGGMQPSLAVDELFSDDSSA